MTVHTNIFSLNAHRHAKNAGIGLARSANRLSSGHRINSAADDAAGLSISETMLAQIRGLDQADRNVRDGVGLLQVVDGALSNIHAILQRKNELTIQAANDTLTAVNRQQINYEFDALKAEIDFIVRNTEFNGINPLMGVGMEPVRDVSIRFADIEQPIINADVSEWLMPPVYQPNVTNVNNIPSMTIPPSGVPVSNLPNIPDSILPPAPGPSGFTDPTILSNSISSGILTIPGPDGTADFVVTAASLAGVHTITVNAPGTLLVAGTLPNYPLTIDGGGNVRITGNLTATGNKTIGANTTVHIDGNVAESITNNGTLSINGTAGQVTNSSNGNLQINGTVGTLTNNGNARLLNAANATVNNNSGGHVVISNPNLQTSVTNSGNALIWGGTGVTITSNSGNVQSNSNNTTVTNNDGNMLLNGNNTTVGSNNTSGSILITGDDATVQNNRGDMRISGDSAVVTTNHANANLCITGASATVTTNDGNLHSSRALLIVTNGVSGQAVADILPNNFPNIVSVFNNAGQLSVLGNSTFVSNNQSTGTAFIQGDGAIITTNAGQMQIVGDDADIYENRGRLHINGNDANITTNSGDAYINGNDATVGTNGNAAQLHIAGDGATIGLNLNHATVLGDSLTILNGNNAEAHISGNGAQIVGNGANSKITVIGDATDVFSNSATGAIQIYGNGSTINSNDGDIRLDVDTNATVVSNTGRINVSSGSIITQLQSNQGTIFVQNNGSINDPLGVNNALGQIEVETGGNINIRLNAGIILNQGSAAIVENIGYLQVGIWDGDDNTPVAGSPTGTTTVGTNRGGIIRNFSDNLSVRFNCSGDFALEIPLNVNGCVCIQDVPPQTQINGGRIENYGTIVNPVVNRSGVDGNGNRLPVGQVRHHARQIDTSGINSVVGYPILSFYANGQRVDHPGSWIPSGDSNRRRLVFAPVRVHGGDDWVIFNAGNRLSMPGMAYDVHYDATQRRPSMEIAGSTGTSGRQVVFEIHRPFLIQSGANALQMTEINFRTVLPEFIRKTQDTCGDCNCTLATTNVLTLESALCTMNVVRDAINVISHYRTEIGAMINRFEHNSRQLADASLNQSDAKSRIKDVDMALETMKITKWELLNQASNSILAQAKDLNRHLVSQLLQS